MQKHVRVPFDQPGQKRLPRQIYDACIGGSDNAGASRRDLVACHKHLPTRMNLLAVKHGCGTQQSRLLRESRMRGYEK